jgi:hypothetical protein
MGMSALSSTATSITHNCIPDSLMVLSMAALSDRDRSDTAGIFTEKIYRSVNEYINVVAKCHCSRIGGHSCINDPESGGSEYEEDSGALLDLTILLFSTRIRFTSSVFYLIVFECHHASVCALRVPQ